MWRVNLISGARCWYTSMVWLCIQPVLAVVKQGCYRANIDDAMMKIQDILESAVETVRPREMDPTKKKKLAKQ